MPNYILDTTDGIVFCVKLVPNSSFSKIVDFTDDYVRIKIGAPAIENRANKALIEFCSDLFKVNKSKLSIISGEKSKVKKVLIKDANKEVITQNLMFVLNSLHK